MNVLGPALITEGQQRQLRDHAPGQLMEIPSAAVYPKAAKRARLGDLFWVREPFRFLRKKRGLGEAIVFGLSPLDSKVPDGFGLEGNSHSLHSNYRSYPNNGTGLRREESRTTLEITQVLPAAAGWQCLVHMQQVDAFVASRGAT